MLLLYWGADTLWTLVLVGLILLLAIILGVQAHLKRVVTGNEEFLGMRGEVTQDSDSRGHAYALVRSEIWRVHARVPLAVGDIIRVRAVRSLMLEVERLNEPDDGQDPGQSSTTKGGES
uniref:NfeD family protein n=1 Tax=Castellaniella defragrans TaxID=75697 RepID=UPI00333FD990